MVHLIVAYYILEVSTITGQDHVDVMISDVYGIAVSYTLRYSGPEQKYCLQTGIPIKVSN